MALDGFSGNDIERHMKPHPLPPDVAYVIDQMMEDDLIDSGTYAALNMYADRKALDDVLDGSPFDRRREPKDAAIEAIAVDSQPLEPVPLDTMRELGRLCIARKRALALAVVRLTDRTLHDLPDSIQGAIAFESIRWLRKTIKSLACHEADWAYEDATVGGAMMPHRHVVRLDGLGHAFKRDMRRLNSRSFIARYVRRCDSIASFEPMAKLLLDRAQRVPLMFLKDTLQDHVAVLEQRRVAAKEDALRRFIDAYQAEKNDRKASPRPERKRAIRYRRQVIKRALKTASAIVGDRVVSAFVRGEWVCFDGCRFDIMVRCVFSVARLGHGSLDVRAVESGNPLKPLADLCVYIEDTPALDQLTGFWLLMTAGREDELIRTANVIKSYPAGDVHPAFAERAKERRLADHIGNADNWTALPPTPRKRSGNRWYDRAKQRQLNESYTAATEPIWVERLTLELCGRRGKLLAIAA